MNADDPIIVRARSMRSAPRYVRVGVAVWCAAALGLTIYQMVGMRGVYGWLAYVQAEYVFSGAYYLMVTFLVTLAAFVAPGFLVLRMFERSRAGDSHDTTSIAAIVADPTLLSAESVRYGRARVINWPEASVVLREDGVAFERGSVSVLCPWTLFASSGSPVVTADALLLPVDRDRLGEIAVSRGPQPGGRGGEVATPFFRLRGGEQVEVQVDYPGPLAELGDAIMSLAAGRTQQENQRG